MATRYNQWVTGYVRYAAQGYDYRSILNHYTHINYTICIKMILCVIQLKLFDKPLTKQAKIILKMHYSNSTGIQHNTSTIMYIPLKVRSCYQLPLLGSVALQSERLQLIRTHTM